MKLNQTHEFSICSIIKLENRWRYNHISNKVLNEEIQVKNKKISYEEKNHRLLWLNIIIRNIKNNIARIYHGITKREMPLFPNEQEYSFNHINMGKTIRE